MIVETVFGGDDRTKREVQQPTPHGQESQMGFNEADWQQSHGPASKEEEKKQFVIVHFTNEAVLGETFIIELGIDLHLELLPVHLFTTMSIEPSVFGSMAEVNTYMKDVLGMDELPLSRVRLKD